MKFATRRNSLKSMDTPTAAAKVGRRGTSVCLHTRRLLQPLSCPLASQKLQRVAKHTKKTGRCSWIGKDHPLGRQCFWTLQMYSRVCRRRKCSQGVSDEVCTNTPRAPVKHRLWEVGQTTLRSSLCSFSLWRHLFPTFKLLILFHPQIHQYCRESLQRARYLCITLTKVIIKLV